MRLVELVWTKAVAARDDIKKTKLSKIFFRNLDFFWGYFWGHLGSLAAVLEAFWTSWGRLDGVLGRLGVLGNA